MNERQYDDERLDRLLEEPAAIANNGFVESVNLRIKQQEAMRMRVFAVVAVVWLVLLLVIFPVQAIVDYFQGLLVIGSQTEGYVQALLSLDTSAFTLPSGVLIPVLFLLLGIYALLSLQIKDW